MSGPVPPREGSVRASILATLPVDGSAVERDVLIHRVLRGRLQGGYPLILTALREQVVVVREVRPDGSVWFRRPAVWVGREVRVRRAG